MKLVRWNRRRKLLPINEYPNVIVEFNLGIGADVAFTAPAKRYEVRFISHLENSLRTLTKYLF